MRRFGLQCSCRPGWVGDTTLPQTRSSHLASGRARRRRAAAPLAAAPPCTRPAAACSAPALAPGAPRACDHRRHHHATRRHARLIVGVCVCSCRVPGLSTAERCLTPKRGLQSLKAALLSHRQRARLPTCRAGWPEGRPAPAAPPPRPPASPPGPLPPLLLHHKAPSARTELQEDGAPRSGERGKHRATCGERTLSLTSGAVGRGARGRPHRAAPLRPRRLRLAARRRRRQGAGRGGFSVWLGRLGAARLARTLATTCHAFARAVQEPCCSPPVRKRRGPHPAWPKPRSHRRAKRGSAHAPLTRRLPADGRGGQPPDRAARGSGGGRGGGGSAAVG